MKKMSCESGNEYRAVQKRRYKKAGRVGNPRLLDEICEVCGYERKHGIELLNGILKASGGKQGGKAQYDSPERAKALKRLWPCSGQLCGKRFQCALPLWLGHCGNPKSRCRRNTNHSIRSSWPTASNTGFERSKK
jgi:hypothetical protein